MKNLMEYNGYFGTVDYNDQDETFYGKVAFIRDLVSYEGQSVQELKQSFHDAVEDYLELCQREQKTPEKSFKGSFNIRTGPELHRKAWEYAETHNTNVNQVVKEALKIFLEAS
jgi:predicted HicB family RNase H-like nuclease